MKGLAFRKLSRTSGHRNHLLRNLVTSLFEHERISTTVAKAKEAQREAEKIITKAKKAHQADRRGADRQWLQAKGYVFHRWNVSPIMRELAKRYEERPGGYTRLHLYGNRPGDNAPRALLELVDNAKGDLKVEITARAMGREALLALKKSSPGVPSSKLDTKVFLNLSSKLEDDLTFNELTRLNIAKVVKYNPEEKRAELYRQADEHFRRLVASEELDGPRRPDESQMNTDLWEKNGPRMDSDRLRILPSIGRTHKAGVQLADQPHGANLAQPKPLFGRQKSSVIRLGKGSFAKRTSYKINPSSYKGARGLSARWQ